MSAARVPAAGAAVQGAVQTHTAYVCVNCALAAPRTATGVSLFATERRVRGHINNTRACRTAGLGWRMVQSSVRLSDREAGGTAHSLGARRRGRGDVPSDEEEAERPRAPSPAREGDDGNFYYTICTGYTPHIQWIL